MIHYYIIPGIKANIKLRYDNASINQQVELVLEVVCHYFNLKKEELISRSRKRELVVPRQILIWFLKNKFNITCTKLGDVLNFDHTTILHSCKRVDLIKDENLNYPEKIHFDRLSKLI